MTDIEADEAGHIFEVTVAVTVLVEAENAAQASQEVERAGLEGLAYEIDEGAWLGQSRILDTNYLPPDRLTQRQLELGSDGTFYPAQQPAGTYDAESDVLRLQVSQGWSSETMSMLMHGFLRETGLMGVFAERLRKVAEVESSGPDASDSPAP